MQVLRRDAAQARHRVLLEEGLELARRCSLTMGTMHCNAGSRFCRICAACRKRGANRRISDERLPGRIASTRAFWSMPSRTRGGPVRLHRHRAGQRMADVGDRYAFLAVDLFLERKQYQHVRNRLADLVDALIAPRPDRRTDEVHRGRAGLAQLMLQAQVEIRRVDANEHGRRLGQPAPLDVAIGGQQAGQALERVDVAEHGQGMHGMPGIEVAGLHLRPADAFATHRRVAGLQAGDDATGQQVARGLARHHADALAHCASPNCPAALRAGSPARLWRPAGGHGRMMPREATSRKSRKTCNGSATPGSDCWRAFSSARASSSDRPRR